MFEVSIFWRVCISRISIGITFIVIDLANMSTCCVPCTRNRSSIRSNYPCPHGTGSLAR